MDLRRRAAAAGWTSRPSRGPGRWLALVQVHHLILDHTGLEVVLAEVRALLAGQADLLPAPVPFRDFVAQARLGMPREEHEALLRRPAGRCDRADRGRSGWPTVRGDGEDIAEARAMLDDAVAARLRAAARQRGCRRRRCSTWCGRGCWRRCRAVMTWCSARCCSAGWTRGRGRSGYRDRSSIRCRSGSDVTAGGRTRWRGMQAQLGGLLAHEHAPLALAQPASGIDGAGAVVHVAVQLPARRAGAPGGGAGCRTGWRLLYVRERTNYPVTVSVDDDGIGVRGHGAGGGAG